MEHGPDSCFAGYELARAYGFARAGRPGDKPAGYRAKPGSHDDGPDHGPFLGPLGGPNFSRDLAGRFSRWHLQPGVHLVETVPQASFLLHCAVPGAPEEAGGCRFVGGGEAPGWDLYRPSFGGFAPEYADQASLFPCQYEHYDDPALPVELLLSCWSPLLYGSDDASLPLIFFTFTMRNRLEVPAEVSIAHFWPNLLGWRQEQRTSVDRGGRAWPGQTHAGNRCMPAPGGVLQCRYPGRSVEHDLEGELFLAVRAEAPGGSDRIDYGREVCFKADQNAVGTDPALQKHTQAWAQEYFARTGTLPGTELEWQAHWHEPLSSALSCRVGLEPRGGAEITFLQAWDLPKVVFGSGRAWDRRYTRRFGTDGRSAAALAACGFEQRAAWFEAVLEQSRAAVGRAAARGWEAPVIGAALNERFFLTGGGTVWLDGPSPSARFPEPLLGEGERFGLLEGYDTGYYYYNTFDLWIYAFPSLAGTWPSLARLVFDEYLETIPMTDDRRRIVYRLMEERAMLVEGKIPHDIGTPAEDPWHELNGYVMRDDPNTWRDHNPSFIISWYLFTVKSGGDAGKREWDILKKAYHHMLAHDLDGDALPEHGEFGDSTWDALHMKGVSSFSGGLTLAAHAVMARMAPEFGDPGTRHAAADRLAEGLEAFEEKLWTGSFYRTDSEGPYRDSVMADALIGPWYAKCAGMGALLPEERIKSHLKTCFEYNFLRYGGGKAGPLLVSDGTGKRYAPDGGEELQINEVLAGSAWLFCAMLREFGLGKEASEVGASLARVVYRESGLQFRTPAAWDAEGKFRAPLNMRPLSAGFLFWP